ncbi:MAG: hypothetical protein WAV56_00095 [Microgenomates group bacterium]
MAKKKAKSFNRLAWIVSRLFDPVIEIPLLIASVIFMAVANGLRFRFLIFLLFTDAVLPAVYMLWGLATKRISDWDMTRRQERSGLYFFTIFCHLFGVVLAYLLGKILLAKILFIFWSLAVVFALITVVWKISVHAGVNAAALAFFNHYYGWSRYWWLVPILVVVLWARVAIKKHTWTQVTAGAILAVAWVELLLLFSESL